MTRPRPADPPPHPQTQASEPRTLAGSVALGAFVTAVFPLAGVWIAHVVLGRPVPFASLRDWGTFVLTAAALGAAAGAASFGTRRFSSGGWAREWGERVVYLTMVVGLVNADRFLDLGPLRWVALAALAGALASVCWVAVGRFWAAGWRTSAGPGA